MKNKVTVWLKVAVVFQFLTAAIHALTLFRSLKGRNETEKQLFELMNTYSMDMGAGFHRTMGQIFTSVSACFTLLFLLGALINALLIRKQASADLLKGIVGMQALIFGIVFIVAFFFAFLPPITFAGLVFLFLALSYFRIELKKES